MNSEQVIRKGKAESQQQQKKQDDEDNFRLSDDGETDDRGNFKVPVLQITQEGGGDSMSNHHPFFSEPSASEDADSDRIRAARFIPPRPRFLSGSSDEEHAPSSYPQQQHFISFYPSFPTSPGNTSISSWDSPAMTKRKVLLQWPVPVRRNRIDRLARYESSGRHHHHPAISATQSTSTTPTRRDYNNNHEYYPPSVSPHPDSEEGHDDDDSEDHDVRRSHSSKGGESHSSDHTNARLKRSDSSLTEEDRRSFQDSDSIFRFLQTSFSPKNNRTNHHSKAPPKMDQSSVNDSLNMTFSDSEPEDESSAPFLTTTMNNNNNNPTTRPNKRRKEASSEAHNSADDEKTVQRPPRIRAMIRPIHRRTRSGDGAAAKLVRHGTKDWKGMELDRIPLPDEDDNDDEDDEETGLLRPPSQRTHRNTRQPQPEPQMRKDRVSSKNMIQRKVYGPFIPSNRRNNHNNDHHSVHHNLREERPVQPKRQYDSKKAWLMQMANLDVSTSSVNGDPVIITDQKTLDRGSKNNHPSNTVIRGQRMGTEERRSTSAMNSSGATQDGKKRVNNDNHIIELERLKQRAEGNSTFPRIGRHFSETSPFANFGKAVPRTPRSSFRPPFLSAEHDPKKVPTFVCPRCGTRQREFFSVADAPEMMRGPASYLAAYFTIYVIASLFIFGLEEGWDPLDCIYFAVVTLTTAGLGDNVPTSDANKVICSIFIFFGVSCIGLLLGSYIAGILDERARIDRKSKLADSCPNCARLRTIKDVVEYIPESFGLQNANVHGHHYQTERSSKERYPHFHPVAQMMQRESHAHRHGLSRESEKNAKRPSPSHSTGSLSLSHGSAECHAPSPVSKSQGRQSFGVNISDNSSPPLAHVSTQNDRVDLLGSPVTRQILGRQKHTRHASFDLNEDKLGSAQSSSRSRRSESRTPTFISENIPLKSFSRSGSRYGSLESEYATSDAHHSGSESDDEGSDDASTSSESSLEEVFDENLTKLKTAKYVFLTLRQALVNSMTIIAAGSLGFYFIEKWSMIDSWYFTTVFLTTVGYGDIVPITKGGKLFATVYILVAGTILLNNMSAISLIPLELRKRRLERAVLMQFGDQLDDAALRELATGPVIQRLRLVGNNPTGLDECTREMFSLAMLVRMGKVNEEEILHTFAAFKRLDVVNEGVLNSRSIIAAMVQKRRNFASRSKSMPVMNPVSCEEEEEEPIPPAPLCPPPEDDDSFWQFDENPLSAGQQRSSSFSPHTRPPPVVRSFRRSSAGTAYHSD